MSDGVMRGDDGRTETLFSDLSCAARVPKDHPRRPIRTMVDPALEVLSPGFGRLYAAIGRPSIPPEKLLRALWLQAFDAVRSARQLMAQRDDNLLFGWFVGLAIDAPIWGTTVFTKNRERFLAGEVAAQFFPAVLGQAAVRARLSDEPFSVEGTLIEAWASMKSCKPKDEADDGSPASGGGRHAARDFHGEKRTNDSHASTTGPDARRFRQGRGKEAKLGPMGHLLMANRHGLIVDALVTQATGSAERAAAEAMLSRQRGRQRATLGADQASDGAAFVADLRALNLTPHVAQTTTGRPSAIDARTTRHPGHATSPRIRKRIEASFGGIKTVGGLRTTRHRGTARVGWMVRLTAAAGNRVRRPKLLQAG